MGELDLTVAPLSPSPPPASPPKATLQTSRASELDREGLRNTIVDDAMEVDTDEDTSLAPVGAPSSSKRKLDQLNTGVATSPSMSTPFIAISSPQVNRSPSPPKASSALNSPASFLPPPPIASTSFLPYASSTPSTISPALLMPPLSHSSAHHPSISHPGYDTGFSISDISPNYVDLLPELSSDVQRVRMLAANVVTKRKGKEKAGVDLWKMNIKANYMGAKNFLGKGKRVHNVLSTHDWGVSCLLCFERRVQATDFDFD